MRLFDDSLWISGLVGGKCPTFGVNCHSMVEICICASYYSTV